MATGVAVGTSKVVGKIVGKIKNTSIRYMRSKYVKEVNSLKELATKYKSSGKDNKEIATILYNKRNVIKKEYLVKTSPELLKSIKERNLIKYGNENGPSIDFLRKQGKSWDDKQIVPLDLVGKI